MVTSNTPSSITRRMGWVAVALALSATTTDTWPAPRRSARTTVSVPSAWAPSVPCGSYTSPVISSHMASLPRCPHDEHMRRLDVRVEFDGVVLAPFEARPGEDVRDEHPFVPVEAERGHVQRGVGPVHVAGVEG